MLQSAGRNFTNDALFQLIRDKVKAGELRFASQETAIKSVDVIQKLPSALPVHSSWRALCLCCAASWHVDIDVEDEGTQTSEASDCKPSGCGGRF